MSESGIVIIIPDENQILTHEYSKQIYKHLKALKNIIQYLVSTSYLNLKKMIWKKPIEYLVLRIVFFLISLSK